MHKVDPHKLSHIHTLLTKIQITITQDKHTFLLLLREKGNEQLLLYSLVKYERQKHVPYSAYTSRVFIFTNFANLESFAKLIQVKFEP